jgi:endonuclease/exonuclease/phosphatase family metal-dependent hydrolase
MFFKHVWFAILVLSLVGCEPAPKALPTAEVVPEATTSDTTAESAATSSPVTGDGAKSEREVFILAWNVESGGADPMVIAARLATYQDIDIFCLSEVNSIDFETHRSALGDDFASVTSKSGNDDRLQILYDQKRFELLETIELNEYRDYVLNNGGHRSPTAVRLRDRQTDQSFVVMVNHLARGNAEFRKKQAIGLREWARDQSMGVINLGDFNMDYVFATSKGNDALDEILRDNVWTWVQPGTWIDTNWWDPEGDGVDNFEGSLLDFAFVSGPAKTWDPKCEVIVERDDFPDDATTSDHRPIKLRIAFPE